MQPTQARLSIMTWSQHSWKANFNVFSSTDSLQLQRFDAHKNKNVATRHVSSAKYLQNAFVTGALPLTLLELLTAFPLTLQHDWQLLCRREGQAEREGQGRRWERGEEGILASHGLAGLQGRCMLAWNKWTMGHTTGYGENIASIAQHSLLRHKIE